MFVVSIKSDKLKKIFAIFIALLTVTIGGIVYVSSTISVPTAKISGKSMKAETNEDRVAFFSQFSLNVNEDPAEVKEVVIPPEFDDVYNSYNELQKSQGLDLEPYKGVRVKMWSYEVLNYPGFENSGTIRGNLLVYNGNVIGGDVCNIQLDGFMTSFDGTTKSIQ